MSLIRKKTFRLPRNRDNASPGKKTLLKGDTKLAAEFAQKKRRNEKKRKPDKIRTT